MTDETNAQSSTFEPRRFRANVPYYARYRLDYPESLIKWVAAIVGLEPGDRVMDLGCGPGLLAIPLTQLGMAVTAIDPEPEMLAALRAAAAQQHVWLDVREGSSFAMPADLGCFRLVTMGRSFHWMDRIATLRMLEACVAPEGAVAFFHDRHPRTAENGWRRLLHEVSNAYGRLHSPHVREIEKSNYRTHESLLMDSAFSRVESVGVFVRRELTPDDIVGLGFSLSSTSPDKLGARAAEFEKELREGLAKLDPDGRFVEIAEMTAIIACKP
ncbi:MAG: class I SAM-dependent methyltransferase [Rhizomicrobium sp.]|jgi:SAM-dependent methyltransferase